MTKVVTFTSPICPALIAAADENAQRAFSNS
jgi:hypothetical protein